MEWHSAHKANPLTSDTTLNREQVFTMQSHALSGYAGSLDLAPLRWGSNTLLASPQRRKYVLLATCPGCTSHAYTATLSGITSRCQSL